HGNHHRFGSAVVECTSFNTCHFTDELGDLRSVFIQRPYRQSPGELLMYGFPQESRVMTKEVHTETHRDIEIIFSVDAIEISPCSIFYTHGENQFFQG